MSCTTFYNTTDRVRRTKLRLIEHEIAKLTLFSISVYIIWTLATYILEGRVNFLQRVDPLGRIEYAIIANIQPCLHSSCCGMERLFTAVVFNCRITTTLPLRCQSSMDVLYTHLYTHNHNFQVIWSLYYMYTCWLGVLKKSNF